MASPNTNTTPHNTNNSPTDVRVVSQSQSSRSLSLGSPDSGILSVDQQLSAICDGNLNDNTPECNSPNAVLIQTPILSSPDRAVIRAQVNVELFSNNTKRKEIGDVCRQRFHSRNVVKRRKFRDPAKSILWFLRQDKVDSYGSTMQNKSLSTLQKYAPAYASWSKVYSREPNHFFKPFNDLRTRLMKSNPALSIQHRRLLFEDLLMLDRNATMTCCLNKTHELFSDAKWTDMLRNELTDNPLEPLTLNNTIYFAFNVTVQSNIDRSLYKEGYMTIAELTTKCTYTGGNGLVCKFANNHRFLIKFQSMLDYPKDALFFMRNVPTRLPQLKKIINSIKDVTRIGPTALRMLDETFGDGFQYLQILNTHDGHLASKQREAAEVAFASAGLSSKRIIQAFTLDNADAAFVNVRNEVESVMSESVFCVYGQFSELTTPILTQVSHLYFNFDLCI